MKHFLGYAKTYGQNYINYSTHIVAESYEDAFDLLIKHLEWNYKEAIPVGIVEHHNPLDYKRRIK